MVQYSNDRENLINIDLEKNLAVIRKTLGNASDLIIREGRIGVLNHPFALIYIKGLINEDLVNTNILRVLELNKKIYNRTYSILFTMK